MPRPTRLLPPLAAVLAAGLVPAAAAADPALLPASDLQRLTNTGSDAVAGEQVADPDAARDPETGRILLVFTARTPAGPGKSKQTIMGRLLGPDLRPLGAAFPVSQGAGDDTRDATRPKVAFNPQRDEWIVVWQSNAAPLNVADVEIFANRISAAGARLHAPEDVRLSESGVGAVDQLASAPDVAVDEASGEALVAWTVDVLLPPPGGYKEYVRGRVVDGTLGNIGSGAQLPLAARGAENDLKTGAARPAVVHHPGTDRYVLTTVEKPGGPGWAPEKSEVFARHVHPNGSVSSPLTVSQTADPATRTNIGHQALAVAPGTGEIVVAWSTAPGTGGMAPTETELYAQRLDADLDELGATADRRVTRTGVDGDASVGTYTPAVAPLAGWNVIAGAAYPGAPFGGDEMEVYAQLADPALAPLLPAQGARLAVTGPDGDDASDGSWPVLVPTGADTLAALWLGAPGTGGLMQGKQEAFGRLLQIGDDTPAPPAGGGTPGGGTAGPVPGGTAPGAPTPGAGPKPGASGPRRLAGKATVDRAAVKLTRTRATLRVTCASGGPACAGTVALRDRSTKRRLGARTFRLAAGTAKTITVAIARRHRTLLRTGHARRVTVELTGATVAPITTTLRVTIRRR